MDICVPSTTNTTTITAVSSNSLRWNMLGSRSRTVDRIGPILRRVCGAQRQRTYTAAPIPYRQYLSSPSKAAVLGDFLGLIRQDRQRIALHLGKATRDLHLGLAAVTLDCQNTGAELHENRCPVSHKAHLPIVSGQIDVVLPSL